MLLQQRLPRGGPVTLSATLKQQQRTNTTQMSQLYGVEATSWLPKKSKALTKLAPVGSETSFTDSFFAPARPVLPSSRGGGGSSRGSRRRSAAQHKRGGADGAGGGGGFGRPTTRGRALQQQQDPFRPETVPGITRGPSSSTLDATRPRSVYSARQPGADLILNRRATALWPPRAPATTRQLGSTHRCGHRRWRVKTIQKKQQQSSRAAATNAKNNSKNNAAAGYRRRQGVMTERSLENVGRMKQAYSSRQSARLSHRPQSHFQSREQNARRRANLLASGGNGAGRRGDGGGAEQPGHQPHTVRDSEQDYAAFVHRHGNSGEAQDEFSPDEVADEVESSTDDEEEEEETVEEVVADIPMGG